MNIVDYIKKDLNRREFLKKSVQATLAGTAAFSLESLLGCAPGLKETRKDVMNQSWDCNPILPIPPVGCYTGTNAQASLMRPDLEEFLMKNFEKKYGQMPTFSVPGYGRLATYNEFFPYNTCQVDIEMGVIPSIRYVILPFEGYKSITKGKSDNEIMKFAHQVAEFKHPIVLIPFQFPNEPNREHYLWGAYPSDQYIEAWIRMHDLFSREGANKNTIWSLKLQAGQWADFQYPDPFQYVPPEEYFDIIGWAPNNICQPEIGLYYQSFKSLFDYYYKKSAKKFPTKPQIIWELASAQGPDQDEWYDNALTLIENTYPRVKGVVLDENAYRHGRINTNPIPTPDSVKVIKNHFTSRYFIGSILKKS